MIGVTGDGNGIWHLPQVGKQYEIRAIYDMLVRT